VCGDVDAIARCGVASTSVRGKFMVPTTAFERRRARRATRAFLLAIVATLLTTWVPAAGASVSLPPGVITVPSSGTFLYMNSQPGDYIGGGIEQLYTSADTAITGSLPEGGSVFNATVIQGPYTHWWYVDIAAPQGQPLAVGSYTGAVRYPFNPPGAGLSISGDGRGCNTLTGAFDVNELSYAPTGELLVFDATFEQHCEGGPAALFGRIRIENPAPPPDLTPPTLHLPTNINAEAPDSLGMYIGYSAYATDDRDSSPTMSCMPASGSFFALGVTTVNCEAVDRSGNRATGSFQITVFGPLQMSGALAKGGSASSRTGIATISGTVSCSRDIEVDVYGQLTQLFARRVTVTGGYYVHVSCRAPGTPWSANVTGSNGRFGAGLATADATVWGCELSCHSAAVSGEVKLTGRQ
jgi:HYR domain